MGEPASSQAPDVDVRGMRRPQRAIVFIKLQGGREWPGTIARRKVRWQVCSPTLSVVVRKWGVDDRPRRARAAGVLHRFPSRQYLPAWASIGIPPHGPNLA